MRAMTKFSRRTFLISLTEFFTIVLGIFGFRSSAKGANSATYKGTPYIGKTRENQFQKFYVNYWKPFLRIDGGKWTLRVHGLCKNPKTFSLSQLESFPKKTQTSRLKCVECWSAKAEWTGFHFSEIDRLTQPLPEAMGVVFRCADDYIEAGLREDFLQPRTLMVYAMNGKPLSDGHGFPLRVIMPFKYGYKNPKAILEIEYVKEPPYGTWSKIGPYSADGTILPGYDHPLDQGKKARKIYGGEIRY